MSIPSSERQLFGILLASTPARTRSWKSLSIALAIHAALIAAAVLTFKPFQSSVEEEKSHPLNIIIVEEDAVANIPNPFVRSAPVAAQPAAQPARPREELVYRPGPLAPIVIESGPPQPAEPEPGEGGVVGGTGRGGLSSRLLPGKIDPRITSATAFPPADKTGAEALRERISDRLSVFNDSMLAEAEAERRSKDWTVTDKNGGRWGIAPDGIYLGKVKLPAVAFSPPAGRRDEINGRVRDFNEIERQVMFEESRSSFKERVESIRQRKAREREEKRKKAEESKPITESR
ncbi:MAG TPA: hypothetical protein VFO52_15040 [Longimicrobiales bacterium]|nr:hypothetical protein [Longimicrobiales bacterium]